MFDMMQTSLHEVLLFPLQCLGVIYTVAIILRASSRSLAFSVPWDILNDRF